MIIPSASTFTFPIINGLHFPKKSIYYPLHQDSSRRIVTEDRPQTLDNENASLAMLSPFFEIEIELFVLVGGGGAWEGEGFLACLEKDSRIVEWLVYSEVAEPFSYATIKNSQILAVSGDGYYKTNWTICIDTVPKVTGFLEKT